MKTMALVLVLSMAVLSLGIPGHLLANGNTQDTPEKIYVVQDPQGNVLGTASKVLENFRGGADFVIVTLDPGKFRGDEILVPFSAISPKDDNSIVLNLNPELLAQAPAYDPTEMYNVKFLDHLYHFYGMAPPWTEGGAE